MLLPVLPTCSLYHIFRFLSSLFRKLFQKTFSCDRRSEKRLDYYTTTCPVCQEFFQTFSKSFSVVSHLYTDDLFIISLPDVFVKSFSKLFSEKLLKTYFPKSRNIFLTVFVRQLYHYTTDFRLCQVKYLQNISCFFVEFDYQIVFFPFCTNLHSRKYH